MSERSYYTVSSDTDLSYDLTLSDDGTYSLGIIEEWRSHGVNHGEWGGTWRQEGATLFLDGAETGFGRSRRFEVQPDGSLVGDGMVLRKNST